MSAAEGRRLWDTYRGYEQSLLEAAPSEEQAERLRSLWCRQLQVPLAGAADTLAAYEAWERSRPGKPGLSGARARHAAWGRQPTPRHSAWIWPALIPRQTCSAAGYRRGTPLAGRTRA